MPAALQQQPREAVAEALADLAEDFDLLAAIARGALQRLPVGPRWGDSGLVGARLAADVEAARSGAVAARAAAPRRSAVAQLELERRRLAASVRSRVGVAAALVTADDWQSPPFAHSLEQPAGRHAGRIAPHLNDYKRDRHLDAEAYERAYVQEHVGDGSARALLTSCGMAACTTVLAHLLGRGALRHRQVLVGRGLYHETKELLYAAIPDQVVEMDELVPGCMELALEKLRPAAVFLDSSSNTGRAPVPDLERLLALLERSEQPPYLVVDATGTTVAALPPALRRRPERVRLVLWESLLKYCQLGLDRVNAGMLVAWEPEAEALERCREHWGTNAADVAVGSLPWPDRALLMRRLARLGRNALVVAERLERVADVTYPPLAAHPSSALARRLPFAGACVAVRPAADDEAGREALLHACLAAARRRGLPLVAGSSFGFDVTRVYVTAVRGAHVEPFVRLAVGAEHRLAIEELADALAEAVSGA